MEPALSVCPSFPAGQSPGAGRAGGWEPEDLGPRELTAAVAKT